MSYDDYKLATPTENDTKCHECGKECAHWDLHILFINLKAIEVCYECLDKLTTND
jgi:hypothetical protein